MATSYPTSLDSFSNPTGSDSQSSVTVPHYLQHSNANDAIEAIQAELGLNPSGSSSTVRERLQAIEDAVTALGDTVFGALPDGSVTLAKMAAASVGTTNLVDDSVSAVKLKSDSVTTAKVANLAITGPKIGPGAIDYTKVAAYEKLLVLRSATQAFLTTVADYISFDTETTDTSGFTTAIPTSTITIPSGKAGLYMIFAHVAGFLNHADDYVRIVTTPVNMQGAVNGTYGSATGMVDLAAGNTVRLYIKNGSASTINVTARLYLIKLANI